MTGYNRIERTAFRLGKRLVRYADEHFSKRMAGENPDRFALVVMGGAVCLFAVVAWLS